MAKAENGNNRWADRHGTYPGTTAGTEGAEALRRAQQLLSGTASEEAPEAAGQPSVVEVVDAMQGSNDIIDPRAHMRASRELLARIIHNANN